MNVKVKTEIDMNVKKTDTQGSHAYVVALCCGGVMEGPEFHYHDYQLIRADSEDEARKKYHELNNCSYYYGSVIGEVVATTKG